MDLCCYFVSSSSVEVKIAALILVAMIKLSNFVLFFESGSFLWLKFCSWLETLRVTVFVHFALWVFEGLALVSWVDPSPSWPLPALFTTGSIICQLLNYQISTDRNLMKFVARRADDLHLCSWPLCFFEESRGRQSFQDSLVLTHLQESKWKPY